MLSGTLPSLENGKFVFTKTSWNYTGLTQVLLHAARSINADILSYNLRAADKAVSGCCSTSGTTGKTTGHLTNLIFHQ